MKCFLSEHNGGHGFYYFLSASYFIGLCVMNSGEIHSKLDDQCILYVDLNLKLYRHVLVS